MAATKVKRNPYSTQHIKNEPTGLGRDGVAVTPSDTNDLVCEAAIYVNQTTTMRITPADAADGTYIDGVVVAACSYAPFICKRVWATGTSPLTGITAVYA